ncbi:MAG: carboxypeptidase-like regulatory domain-containing protein [Patescibacteria group bacterium]
MRQTRGFTIIEAVIGGALLAIVAIGVYRGYFTISESVRGVKIKNTALSVVNDEIELARNAQFQNVGILGGYPPGQFASSSVVIKNGTQFTVMRTVRNIDDLFDGTIGSTTNNDTAPADYRLFEVEITCANCKNFIPVRQTTTIAPKDLELSSGGGALFIQVIDANGSPVPQATVRVENTILNPDLVIDDVTNNQGMLQLVDVPPSVGGYGITATKLGYSTDKTHAPGVGNPNPIKADATVDAGVVTQATFAIDRTSTINLSTRNQVCGSVAGVDFHIDGSKLIGTGVPDVLKYSTTSITDMTGSRIFPNLEWDTYEFSIIDSAYDLAGAIPLTPITISPNTTQNLQLLIETKNPKSVLVTVKDSGTSLPVTGATVALSKTGFSTQVITGRGSIPQTDWSGGSGQATTTDMTKFWTSDGNIYIGPPAGEIKLVSLGGDYQPFGWLESSAFDLGSASNFHNISWVSISQPPETGLNSVKFQIATNVDNATWNFVGPDSTNGTYYTTMNTDISNHNGSRYMRYKAFLSTVTATSTPLVSDVSFTFTTSCIPPGQAFFNGLVGGAYTIDITHPSYQAMSTAIEINPDFQKLDVLLNP